MIFGQLLAFFCHQFKAAGMKNGHTAYKKLFPINWIATASETYPSGIGSHLGFVKEQPRPLISRMRITHLSGNISTPLKEGLGIHHQQMFVYGL